MCGDATNKDDVDRLVKSEHVRLALTDPPYGISVVGKDGKIGGGGRTHFENKPGKFCKSSTYAQVIGDESTDIASRNYALVREQSDNQIIFGGNYFSDFLPPSRCWLIWDKQNSGNFADAELAWTSFDKVVKIYRYMWNGLCRKGSRKIELPRRVHPTQKPVGLFMKILGDYSNFKDTILDCFGGSGTTLIAADQTGRKCLMMELSEHYVDIIIERWQELTMQYVVLEAMGEKYDTLKRYARQQTKRPRVGP